MQPPHTRLGKIPVAGTQFAYVGSPLASFSGTKSSGPFLDPENYAPPRADAHSLQELAPQAVGLHPWPVSRSWHWLHLQQPLVAGT